MNKMQRIIDSLINNICRIFKIRFSVRYRALSAEEVKALGLDRLEKGQQKLEKPTEM